MSEQRFPYLKSTLVSFGYFTNNLTWSVFNIFVPLFLSDNLKAILGDVPYINTLIGLIMILDNIASILIQPYIGALSDRTWIPKLGRRMPFVIIGLPLAAFFFGLIGTFQSTMFVVLIGICGFNISMAFYKSPVMSLVPDLLPKEYRSQGAGVLNVVGGVASISGLLIVSSLMVNHSKFAFWALSIIMIICLGILLLTVREKKDVEIVKRDEKIGLGKTLKRIVKERNLPLIFMLLSVFFHTAGYSVAETFISRYSTDLLGFHSSTAGQILAAFIGFSVIAALPAGLVGKRIGALNAVIIGVVGFTVSLIPLTIISLLPDLSIMKDVLTLNTMQSPIFTWQFLFYFLLVFTMGFSYLLLSINSIVVIWNLAPDKETATYTSFFYVALHMAAILSPFIAGVIFDLYALNSSKNGSDFSGLRIMFVYVIACYLLTIGFISLVKIFRNRQLKEIGDKDTYIQQRLEQKEYPLQYIPMLLFGIGTRRRKVILDLRKEHHEEQKEMDEQIRKLRKKQMFVAEDLPDDAKVVDERHKKTIADHRQMKKEMVKEQKEKIREMRQDIIDEKIKKKFEEEYD